MTPRDQFIHDQLEARRYGPARKSRRRLSRHIAKLMREGYQTQPRYQAHHLSQASIVDRELDANSGQPTTLDAFSVWPVLPFIAGTLGVVLLVLSYWMAQGGAMLSSW